MPERACLAASRVVGPAAVSSATIPATGRPIAGRRGHHVASVLARVSSLAEDEGVAVDTQVLSGAVGTAILDAARDWDADVVIIGKSARLATGEPYVGALTRHVLEFADEPVLVVSGRRRHR